MDWTPKLEVKGSRQVEPGELFVFRHARGACLTLAARDDTANGERCVAPIGPALPEITDCTSLMPNPGGAVVSFGKAFTVRLPAGPDAWRFDEPEPSIPALMLADTIFLRCNFAQRRG